MSVRAYLRRIVRRWRLILFCAVAMLLVAAVLSWRAPTVYVSGAQIYTASAGDDSVPWYGRMWSSVVLADRMDGDSTEAPVSPIGEQDGLDDPTAPQSGTTPAPSSTSGSGGLGSLP